MVKLSSIKRNPNNPRIIRNESFRSLVESIKRDPEYLEKRGIVVADGMILGGNQRYSAVREALADDKFRESLGLQKGEIPASWVVDASEWPEEKRRRFIIVDNGMWGEWDFDILANEWSDLPLNDLGIDLPQDWIVPESERLQIADISEDNPKLAKFIEKREKSRMRGKDIGELNFWLCLIFQSYEQKIEFLSKIADLETKYGMYVDGEVFAAKFGIDIKHNEQKHITPRIEQNLVERTGDD